MRIFVKDNRDKTILQLQVVTNPIERVPALVQNNIEGGWLKDIDEDLVSDYRYTIQLKDNTDTLEHYSTAELLEEIKSRCVS